MEVFEADSEVGGMCKTISMWGHEVDLGPHRFFSANQRVNLLWHDLVGEDFTWVERETRILYKRRFFTYPLRLFNTLLGLGLWESLCCLWSFIREQVRTSKDANFAEWTQHRFGQRLYEMFFKTYTEKLWGLPCEQIDAEFAYRKIRKMNFYSAIGGLFKTRKTYREYFAYANRGSVVPYQEMARRFESAGGKIHLKSSVLDIQPQNAGYKLTTHFYEGAYDVVVSSMPLPKLLTLLPAPDTVRAAAKSLQFRNTVLVFVLVEGVDHFPDNWVYVHSPDVEFGRVTNFQNWGDRLNKNQQDTVLCIEYWCSDSDELWSMNEDRIVEKAKWDLTQSGLIKNLGVKAGSVYRIGKSYPVFHVGYQVQRDMVYDYVAELNNFYILGRYGAFKYNNQDHSILMGLEVADAIRQQQGVDPRTINSDLNYEEDAPISEV